MGRWHQGLREGGLGGTSYPGLGGPGLRGSGRVEIVATSFEPNNFFLLCPSSILDFGQMKGPNLSEDLFFFLFFT